MTNKEAIKRLKQVQAEFNENWVDYGCINEAFDLAIKALEERPHGHWESVASYLGFEECKCSICKKEAIIDDWHYYVKSDYCPNCGAKMANNGKYLQITAI